MTIPFNKASLVGREIENVLEAIANGHISGDGPFTKKCHQLLERELGVGKALLTTSCTHALEMCALLLDIKPGDEVILPSYTFVSTVNAFVLRGAVPRFIDIRRDTLNLDERLIDGLLTEKTKAIVAVHYAGIGCEMTELGRIAESRGIPIIEDNAHGLFGKYQGRYLGTFGKLATLSFHETKNFTCGEGGALLINDAGLAERAEILREKGTNRSAFFRGAVDKYGWVDIGSSYLPSEILAAFLYAQLVEHDRIQQSRKRVWETYRAHLAEWAEAARVQLPHIPAHCEQPYHMFFLLFPDLSQRQAFIAHMKRRGILSVFHYVPLHCSEMGRRFGGRVGDCPVTEEISDRLVRLPFFGSLAEADQLRVIQAVREFRGTSS